MEGGRGRVDLVIRKDRGWDLELLEVGGSMSSEGLMAVNLEKGLSYHSDFKNCRRTSSVSSKKVRNGQHNMLKGIESSLWVTSMNTLGY